MLQVDVFWGFAIGAGFAASAARQLEKEKEDKPFENKYFVRTLIFLSCFFVPAAIYQLWAFPEWESMQAFSYKTIPPWVVMLFTLTIVTQGILGYWVAFKFIQSKNYYAPWALCCMGYLCMIFILLYYVDGTGYQRFFYSCREWGSDVCIPWEPGKMDVLKWMNSHIAISLNVLGLFFAPPLLYWMSSFIQQGHDLAGTEMEGRKKPSKLIIIIRILIISQIIPMTGAIIAALMIHYLGWLFGLPLFIAAAYFIFFQRRGLINWQAEKIMFTKSS